MYRYGHAWFEIGIEALSDLNVSQEQVPTPQGPLSLIDFIARESRKPLPAELAGLAHDAAVIRYRNRRGEDRAAPARGRRDDLFGELSARAHARWLPIALTLAALAFVSSLVVVLTVVPKVQTAHHLRVAWTGLDVFEVLALAATGFALQRRPAIVAIPATVTGTLLLADAWLNIIPSTGMARYEGIVMAFLEVPLAALSFWVAAHASR